MLYSLFMFLYIICYIQVFFIYVSSNLINIYAKLFFLHFNFFGLNNSFMQFFFILFVYQNVQLYLEAFLDLINCYVTFLFYVFLFFLFLSNSINICCYKFFFVIQLFQIFFTLRVSSSSMFNHFLLCNIYVVFSPYVCIFKKLFIL